MLKREIPFFLASTDFVFGSISRILTYELLVKDTKGIDLVFSMIFSTSIVSI